MSKSGFIVCAYYTEDTPYEEEILALIESIDRFVLESQIVPYKNRGNWTKNTGIKAEFLLDMAYSYPDRVILYIDADGIIRKYPTFCDYFCYAFHGDLAMYKYRGFEYLTGTMVFIANSEMRLFLSNWRDMQKRNPDKSVQTNLLPTIDSTESRIKITDLPPEYVKIFDFHYCKADAVIEHYQASRRFKKIVARPDCAEHTLKMKGLPPSTDNTECS